MVSNGPTSSPGERIVRVREGLEDILRRSETTDRKEEDGGYKDLMARTINLVAHRNLLNGKDQLIPKDVDEIHAILQILRS